MKNHPFLNNRSHCMGATKVQAFVNHTYKNKTTLVPIAIMLLRRILMQTASLLPKWGAIY